MTSAAAVPQVLDMITEVQPTLRQLPFEEFVCLMSRQSPVVPSVDKEIRGSFRTFAGRHDAITSTSLEQAMSALDRPVSKLHVRCTVERIEVELLETHHIAPAPTSTPNSQAPTQDTISTTAIAIDPLQRSNGHTPVQCRTAPSDTSVARLQVQPALRTPIHLDLSLHCACRLKQ